MTQSPFSDAHSDAGLILDGIETAELDETVASQMTDLIRAFIGFANESATDFRIPHPVHLRVIFTSDFNECVNLTCARSGTKLAAPYRAAKAAVLAVGKVIWVSRQSPAEVVIIISSQIVARENDEGIVGRFYLVAHELGHVLADAMRLGSNCKDRLTPSTVTEDIENAAANLLDEVLADRIAEWWCRLLLKRRDGLDFSICDVLGPPLGDSLFELVLMLCAFAEIDVQGYRETAAGLDQLVPRGVPLVYESLTVLTHLIAMYDAADRINDLRDALVQHGGFVAYFADDWELLVTALTTSPRTEAIEQLQQVVRNIIGRLGLRVENTPDGRLYVQVSEPRFCK